MADIHLVGTAHVSQKSVDEVREAIDEFSPQVVAVELDPGRYAALKEEERSEETVTDLLKGGNFSQLLVQWLLAYLQRRIGMDVGVEPGADMMAAVEEAEARNLPVIFADRDIRITLARFWGLMTLWEKMKMVGAILASVAGIGGEEIDVDTLTEQDIITAALEEFHRFAPNAARALIDERDAYLAHQILGLGARYDRVLAVVGAGHVAGIRDYIRSPERLPPMRSLVEKPKSVPWAKILGAGVIAIFAFLLVLIGFAVKSGVVGVDVLGLAIIYWVLINGILSAACALLAGGHPLSALTAFAVSWMTSLNPLMAAGWFAAITEAKIRKPSAADFQAIVDAETFTEMRRVPLFRVVWVAALTNVGSTIGTFAYFLFIFPILGVDPGVILMAGWDEFVRTVTGLF
jgi:pheromone shutdown-related protein TraB